MPPEGERLSAVAVGVLRAWIDQGCIWPDSDSPSENEKRGDHWAYQPLRRHVPPAVPGIVFLSGGQNACLATAHLNEINRLPGTKPWKISFSYGRALQDPALEAWHGRDQDLPAGQQALYRRASLNGAASVGKWAST